jgi:3',5'-cyclic-AMP phosphodiesterase
VSQLLLAQITDTHVIAADPAGDDPAGAPAGIRDDLFVDNNGRLRAAVERINRESPAVSAVLATGDLANDGLAEEYAALEELLEPLHAPVLPIPGNHDDRMRLRSIFPNVPWAEADHASWVTSVGADDPGSPAIRVIGLDTTLPGHAGAEFDDAREEWLRWVLTAGSSAGAPTSAGAGSEKSPTVLAVHHPPFVTGIEWMDRSGFVGLGRLAAVLREYPVDLIVCGHLHRPAASSIAGVPAQVGLSTVQHVALDLTPGAGVSLVHDPVGYQILRVSDTGIVSHTRYLDPAVEPFRPSWART